MENYNKLHIDPEILKKENISKRMFICLETAYIKTKRRIPFGLKDLPGSKAGLINRELIECVFMYINKRPVSTWRLTKKGRVLYKFFMNQTS